MRLARVAGALLLAAVLGLAAAAQDGPAPPEPPPPPAEPPPRPLTPKEAVRAKIAALELDAARDALSALKLEAKSAAEKDDVKLLEREIALGRQVEAAAKKVAKLVEDRKPRDAYALALATGEQLAGALALPGLKARAREAQTLAYEVAHDFDGLEQAVGAVIDIPGKSSVRVDPRVILNFGKAFVIADPMGGKALHWVPSMDVKTQRIDITFGGGTLDLAHYEYATVRFRCLKAPTTPLYFHCGNAGDLIDRFTYKLPIKPGNKWHEVRVPLGQLEKKGDVDPTQIGFVALHYQGVDGWEGDIDEVMLAKKPAK